MKLKKYYIDEVDIERKVINVYILNELLYGDSKYELL